eukprot:CAMPEP_0197833326 /NCGR_PEP_ID=MMETSP1437-20131217/18666_1 /TAXON_ID=49252 ORGANISM="Eucampia antarctica, Strain CCMP1452" /NCGR_SAMPLE_ID=MMETSP1437 /ASSEMBLY_ACC=CAM_ASM_001096 /LENGTH=693 /DNA_ID=CAMNT_0043437309 /DNA_START=80 /DNA_END=2161 /DNA_ORIENTATION=+
MTTLHLNCRGRKRKGTFGSNGKCNLSVISLAILVITIILYPYNCENTSEFHHVDAFVFSNFPKNPPFWNVRKNSLIQHQKHLNVSPDSEDMDDETLLKTVKKSKLQELCEQYNVSVKGTKEELLERLRSFAEEQVRLDRSMKLDQKQRIESSLEGSQGKAKYRLVDPENIEEDGDEDFDGVFFFQSPGKSENKIKDKSDGTNANDATENPITVPPPPPDDTIPVSPTGERVVTVYSSSDQNDLTGIDASAASSLGGSNHAMMGGLQQQRSDVPENTLAGGPFGDSSGSLRKKKNNSDVDSAREAVTDLVRSLLAITGAPAFNDEVSDGFNSYQNENNDHSSSVKVEASHSEFVGFNPDRVPIDLLTQCSKSLRIEEGSILEEVLSEFELQGIGHDGINAPDDRSRGGGHYIEVQKVRAFLEGYRKAETKRIARETLTLLLDKLVVDGVKSLDEMLMTMTKDDSTNSDVGELNDSLFQHLNEVIRQQERKVELVQGSIMVNQRQNEGTKNSKQTRNNASSLNELWNVTKDETGNIIEETIDPNDERVKELIKTELADNASESAMLSPDKSPSNPAEQLLILLCLLRDRLKAEAVFEHNEKGKNLRVLAYCLHAPSDDIDQIVVDNFGSSLTNLDSFAELLISSIDYAESTAHQLMPSKKNTLDLSRLRRIREKVDVIKERLSWKASGISPHESR